MAAGKKRPQLFDDERAEDEEERNDEEQVENTAPAKRQFDTVVAVCENR